MMERKCGNCKYYSHGEDQQMGLCEYPVPDPLRHITFFKYDHEGKECQTLEFVPSGEDS